MNINAFIIEKSTTKPVLPLKAWNQRLYVDHISFCMIFAIDKLSEHVPEWFKVQRFHKLTDHLINELGIPKTTVKYEFVPFSIPNSFSEDIELNRNTHLTLKSFTFEQLSWEQLSVLSNILPSADFLPHITFDAQRDVPKDKLDTKKSVALRLANKGGLALQNNRLKCTLNTLAHPAMKQR